MDEYVGDGVELIVEPCMMGFMGGGPRQRVAGCRGALEGTINGELLVHVVDASGAVWLEQIEQVN
ncbi:GTPase HflX, partial [Burkholderia pseudomallei]